MNIGSMSADERRLRQVLLNLIGNAINFTPPGGKVVIKGERVKDEIWMVVADTGQGITPEEQANVFEKFKRGNTKKAGAGLGLSLVKSFVELHGGSVELKSEVGKGTIIICKIPAQPAKQKAA
jgi:signal transduction histidine kinase